MGFQEKNGSVLVTAKLTDLGKKYLLTDPARFKITKFSPFDDEVDYTLWNEENPNGSAYYGKSIEQLPLLEPVVSNIFQLKYNLIRNLPIGTLRMPTFTVSPTSVTITKELYQAGTSVNISVVINNYDEPRLKVVLLNSTLADITADAASPIDVNPLAMQQYIGESGYSYAKAFEVDSNKVIRVHGKINTGPGSKYTKVIIIGTQTNARYEVPITIEKNNQMEIAADA
tara:strand:- start:1917 stop:2600 length:684 start_codon:yes stop_codon:yes gene_type:complete